MQVREPQQDRGYARRDAVLTGAATVFEQYGYGQASLKQIGEVSGATIGSVYFYFPSKESIALSVIEEQNRRTFAAMQDVSAAHRGVEALIHTSKSVADLLLTDVVVQAGIRLSLEQGTLSSPTAQFYRDWMDGLVPALQDARDAGELATSLPLADLAQTLVPYFTGVHVVSKVLSARTDLYRDLRTMWHVIIPGIVAVDHRARLLELAARTFTGPQRRAATEAHSASVV
ncbi:ScbR family autoregulator-binding transcription factor [Luteimicrobium sp. DT211]|uniref:ScbR family autoregulator-binding transcription factor n=1 Tax=Luteimicrobium sp. DT211 TaxID=3393412 RepID=UPI003CF0EFE3